MVEAGWDHDTLMAMQEADFGFWLAQTAEWDKLKAEAQRKAARAANKG